MITLNWKRMVVRMKEACGFGLFVLRRFNDDRCLQIAGSLTYTTLLALVPFLAIVFTVISAFPMFEDFMVGVKVFLLLNLVPEVAGKIITVYMEQFSQNAARLSAVGFVFLLVTALVTMSTIDRAFNSIWRVRRQRPWKWSLLTYWAMITLGPVLIGLSLSLKVYLLSLTEEVISKFVFLDWVWVRVVPVLVTAIAFFLFYRFVPNRFVPRQHALFGGVVAALLFEGMKHLLGLYVRSFPTYDLIYGAFASIPIFLLWLFLAWMVILLGAEVTASLSHWRSGLWRRVFAPEVEFQDALSVSRELMASRDQGRAIALTELRDKVDLPLDELEDILDRLLHANIIEKTTAGTYVLVKNPDQVTVAELYRLFVLRGGTLRVEDLAALSPALARAASDQEAAMKVTLLQAFPARERGEAESPAA